MSDPHEVVPPDALDDLNWHLYKRDRSTPVDEVPFEVAVAHPDPVLARAWRRSRSGNQVYTLAACFFVPDVVVAATLPLMQWDPDGPWAFRFDEIVRLANAREYARALHTATELAMSTRDFHLLRERYEAMALEGLLQLAARERVTILPVRCLVIAQTNHAKINDPTARRLDAVYARKLRAALPVPTWTHFAATVEARRG